MAIYIAMRIMDGAMKYEVVVGKFPQYKEGIDTILIGEGKEDLIKEI